MLRRLMLVLCGQCIGPKQPKNTAEMSLCIDRQWSLHVVHRTLLLQSGKQGLKKLEGSSLQVCMSSSLSDVRFWFHCVLFRSSSTTQQIGLQNPWVDQTFLGGWKHSYEPLRPRKSSSKVVELQFMTIISATFSLFLLVLWWHTQQPVTVEHSWSCCALIFCAWKNSLKRP